MRKTTRLYQIAVVLSRHGFGDLVRRLGFKAAAAQSSAGTPQTMWARLRMAIEELGPTFVKIGQIFSQRPDLLPKELILELRKLQDQVPPAPWEDIELVLEQALGCPLAEVFCGFERTPLAAASIAQVHLAWRRDDGRKVAVKVRRPRVPEQIAADLALLMDLAQLLERRVARFKDAKFTDLVREISSNLRQETDFENEAMNMRMAKDILGPEAEAEIPDPHLDLTSSALLVMDFMEGVRLDEADLSLAHKKQLAEQLAKLVMRMVLMAGFFHGDPHPGNVLVDDSGPNLRLVLLDWGLAGRMSAAERFLLADLLHAVVDRDSAEIVNCLLKVGITPPELDRQALARDIDMLLNIAHSRALKQLNLMELFWGMMAIMQKYHLRMQVQFAVLDKSLLVLEGLTRNLDPDFDPVAVARPFVAALWKERLSPEALQSFVRGHFMQLFRFMNGLPNRLDLLLTQMERGEVAMQFRHRGLRPITRALDQASARVALGMILAGTFAGSTLLLILQVGPQIWGMSILGLIGYSVSLILIVVSLRILFRLSGSNIDSESD